MNPEKNDKRLNRWLLIATIALLALVLGLQLWQMFRAGPAAGGQPLAQDAGTQSASAQPAPISPGKTAMIEAIQAQNASLSAEALSALSVEELEQLWEAGAPGMPIGLSAAAYAAEAYAGTLEADSVTCDADPELDESPAHYEVELHHAAMGDFDYEVDAYTGEILKGIPDILQSAYVPAAAEADASTSSPASQAEPQPSQPAAPAVPAAQKPAAQQPAASSAQEASSALVGETAAKTAAFTHAGVSEANASQVRCKLDWDDGRQVYEVEFLSGNTEYDYEIDAATGAVLKSEWEQNSGRGSAQQSAASSAQTALIGEAAAKAAAFTHAGVSEADASRVQCKLDHEDGVQVYEVEFNVGRIEYEYEINAATGAVLKAKIDG